MVLFTFSHQLWSYLWTNFFPVQVYTVTFRVSPVLPGSNWSGCLPLSTHLGFSFRFLVKFWVWSQNRNNAYPIYFLPWFVLKFCSLTTVAGASTSELPLLICSCLTNLHLSDSETLQRAGERSWSCVSWNTALCPLRYRQCRNEIDGEGT